MFEVRHFHSSICMKNEHPAAIAKNHIMLKNMKICQRTNFKSICTAISYFPFLFISGKLIVGTTGLIRNSCKQTIIDISPCLTHQDDADPVTIAGNHIIWRRYEFLLQNRFVCSNVWHLVDFRTWCMNRWICIVRANIQREMAIWRGNKKLLPRDISFLAMSWSHADG